MRSRHTRVAIGTVTATVLMVALLTTPVLAARPYHRIIGSSDGASFAAALEECTTTGTVTECVYTDVTAFTGATHVRGEKRTRGSSVCVHVVTVWSVAGEPVAFKEAGGCRPGADVSVAKDRLRSASIAETSVLVELLYCNASEGWEALCAGASDYTTKVSAAVTGVGAISTERWHAREPLDFAPECMELDVVRSRSRAATGELVLDGVTHRLDGDATTLFAGRSFFQVICRR